MSIKTKCFSKSVTSVILSLCMIFSCISVSLIPTGAARVEGDSAGAGDLGTVFFDNSVMNWSDVYCFVGHANYVRAYKMDALSGNPKVFNKNIGGFTDRTALFFASSASSAFTNGTDSYNIDSAKTTLTSGSYTANISEGSDSGSLFYVTDASNNATLYRQTTKRVLASGSSEGSSGLPSASWNTTADVMNYDGSQYFITYHNVSAGSYAVAITLYNDWNDALKYNAVGEGTGCVLSDNGGNEHNLKITISVESDITIYLTNDNKINVTATEVTYPVSVESEDTSKGTVEAATVSAGATAAVTIPKATPKYGYKFKQWVAESPATIASNATSADTATVTVSGLGGKVTAQFEPDTTMNLRIAGRFHINDGTDWVNTFDGTTSKDWSDTGEDNIKFVYDHDTVYRVDTNASLKELTNQITGMKPYFYVYDKDKGINWYATEVTALSPTNTSVTLSGSSGANSNLYFNSNLDDEPVTLYFNVATGQLSYSVPTYYNVACPAATGGTVSASPARQIAGGEVALTVTPDEGYSLSSLVVKDASNQTVTVTSNKFSMPASDVTVTATFAKNSYNLTKASTQNGSFTLSPAATANYGDTVTVTCTPDADFEVDTVTYNGTAISGTGNTRTFAMPARDTTVAATFKEKKYAITVQNDGHGTVTRGGSTVTGTTEIGNFTPVTLKAENFVGYAFDHWAITTDTATQATVNETTVTLTEGEQSVSGAPLQSTFKFNGTATVKAYFKAVDYSIVVNFAATYAAGNSIRICDANGKDIQAAQYQQSYKIIITLADAYELPSNPFSGTGLTLDETAATNPKVSENVYTYHCVMGDAALNANPTDVDATVTLAAKAPEITNVQVEEKDFSFHDPTSNTFEIYYKQPLVIKATANTFTQLSYTDAMNTQISTSSGTEVTLTERSDIQPDDKDGTKTYTLTVTATNCPTGIAAADAKTDQKTYTIRVSFNDAQKVHYELVQLYDRCLQEKDLDTSYFEANAPLAAYRTAYSAATTEIGRGYPAYDAGDSVEEAQQGVYNELHTQYLNLIHTVKTTTVYVLSKYDNTKPMLLHVWTSGSDAAKNKNYLKMYAFENDSRVGDNTYRMSYDGTFTKNGDRYLYKFTYAGHIDFLVWRGASDTDTSMSDSKKLTGDVTWATEFKEYYIDLSDTNMSSSAPAPTEEAYVDFDLTKINKKVCFDLTESGGKTAAEIKTAFQFQNISSLVTSPEIDVTNTTFKIKGPAGKSNPVEYDMTEQNAVFPTTRSGRYEVTYTVRFTKEGSAHERIKTITTSLWVALDEISVYVDMNENIGTPILNFKYFVDSSGNPVSAGTTGAEEAFLPYEMDLVTGSESIYKYTIKTSKLRKDYKIDFTISNPIKINYIMVEGEYVNTDGRFPNKPSDADIDAKAFEIDIDAEITGEAWFKADSTHLKTFERISYGSVTSHFLAVTESGNTVLNSAFDYVRGTGINTDEDEVYASQYAALYTLDEQTDCMKDFKYVLHARVKEEVSASNGTYYFDKWVAFKTPVDGVPVSSTTQNDVTVTTLTFPDGENAPADYSDVTDINLVKAYDFNEGNGHMTYVALYKQVSQSDPTVRVEVTYKFKDYDTSDGNYIFDETKDKDGYYTKVKNASYTKTVKVQTGTGEYSDLDAVKSAAETIAQANLPYITSNYFDYSYETRSATVEAAKENDVNIVRISASLSEAAHPYRIVIVDADDHDTPVGMESGHYQQTVTLTLDDLELNKSYPVWMDSNDNILAVGSSYTARFVASGFESNGNDDCQIIKVKSGKQSDATNHTSVVTNSTTTADNDGTNLVLHHNFYITDYCSKGELIGGGVLFATTDEKGYRQTKAAAHLKDKETRESFITGILSSPYDVEYKAQTIDNVGFRYKPFNSHEDVFRYSDISQAYQTVYTGSNVNSASYQGQKLRLFSFMVYKTGENYFVVSSEGYGEVDRYLEQ